MLLFVVVVVHDVKRLCDSGFWKKEKHFQVVRRAQIKQMRWLAGLQLAGR